ncbi:hypothetical protein CBS101457_001013 [Exobasidium rhododendri]|nr:hypothetical protein CBS101457_001013 [Exobasidium rhododendri]
MMLKCICIYLALLQIAGTLGVCSDEGYRKPECRSEYSAAAAATTTGSGIHISSKWTTIGPFPAGMREHQLGTFPVIHLHSLPNLFNVSHPVKVPSTYGKDGLVEVKEIYSTNLVGTSGGPGASISRRITLSYPDLEWSLLRKSTGWAGTQWQAMLVSDFSVHGTSDAAVGITLLDGAEFTIFSEDDFLRFDWEDPSAHTKWYNGDMYHYNGESGTVGSEVPMHSVHLTPGEYKILVKSVFEIRIFGDKVDNKPSISFDIVFRSFDIHERASLRAITAAPFGVAPDILQGRFAGWGVSFALANGGASPIDVLTMELVGESSEFLGSEDVSVPFRIDSFQTRPAKLRIVNLKSLPPHIESLDIKVTYGPSKSTLSSSIVASLPLYHVEGSRLSRSKRLQGTSKQVQFCSSFQGDHASINDECPAYKFTYLDSDQTVQYATAIPPKHIESLDTEDLERPVVIYLHGAGADIRGCQTLQQNQSWVIQPMGRSSWGYDWQGASHTSATTALMTFARNLYGLSDSVKAGAAKLNIDKIMIVGHSNGGQGALHYATHRPDKIVGAVIGAGYISLAEYVAMTWQLGRHYNDASLNGILRSSLNAFENDLFASNAAGLPFLFKHGSIDDNVPTWHSREMASLLANWNRHSLTSQDLVQLSEVANRSHHWPEFMQEADVQKMIESNLFPKDQKSSPLQRFTLAVLNPEDSESKQGWRIMQVEVPGRIARLEVGYLADREKIKAKTSYVVRVQVKISPERKRSKALQLEIDDSNLDVEIFGNTDVINLKKSQDGWRLDDEFFESSMRPMGPMIRFLDSPGPLQIIIPTNCPTSTTDHYLSIARRFSTDSYLYGRIDTVIKFDEEIIDEGGHMSLGHSNVLFLGGPTVNTAARVVTSLQTVITFLDGSSQFKIRDRLYAEATTLLTLFPHPSQGRHQYSKNEERGEVRKQPMALLLHGTDSLAIERGSSLLPVRTGTLLPEWIVVDKTSVWKGYGGVVGAGWFDQAWGWSDPMSYLS